MLPEINTILYASDISEGSRPAFRMAVKQAINNNARIVFYSCNGTDERFHRRFFT